MKNGSHDENNALFGFIMAAQASDFCLSFYCLGHIQ